MKPIQSLVCAAAVAFAAPIAASATESPVSSNANCVAWFTSTLAQAGVAGPVISSGGQTLSPFGRNVVSQQASAERGSCPFDPNRFVS
jgi:hypothetical protein